MLLHQIKRCSAPCTGEIDLAAYANLVRQAREFLSGKSQAVQQQLSGEMEKASAALDFERAAIYRDRLAALSAIQAQQGINPQGVEEADVFAIHQAGGFNCVQVFFFRTGQNWGNRAYFPRADRSLSAAEVLSSFIAQFYDDKPCPRCIFVSEDFTERELLAEALSTKSGRRIDVIAPKRGEKKDLVEHALANAREALGPQAAETLTAEAAARPGRHFQAAAGARAGSRFLTTAISRDRTPSAPDRRGPEGFENQYRKFNIRSADLARGDDYGMMRRVFCAAVLSGCRRAPAPAKAKWRRAGGRGATPG